MSKDDLTAFTVINTGELHKIRNAFAGGVYVCLQMYIQLNRPFANMGEIIKILKDDKKVSTKKVLDAINYLIAEEVMILDADARLVYIHELFNKSQ